MKKELNGCAAGEKKCSGRREFIVRTTAVAGGLLLTLPGLKLAEAAEEKDRSGKSGDGQNEILMKLDAKNPLYKVGGSGTFKTSAGNIVIARISESEFKAVSAVCTHMGGPIVYDKMTKQLFCTTHNSRFTLEGRTISGPATLDLKSYVADSAVLLTLKSKS